MSIPPKDKDKPENETGIELPLDNSLNNSLPSISMSATDSEPEVKPPGTTFPTIETAIQLGPTIGSTVGSTAGSTEEPLAGFTIDTNKGIVQEQEEDLPSENPSSLKYWLLRLQKIAQQYKYINSNESTAEINQNTIDELCKSLEKENTEFKDKAKALATNEEDIAQRHAEKYTPEQLKDFQTAGINIHTDLSITKNAETNGFDIKFGDNTVSVALQKSEQGASEASIIGSPTTDGISGMLLAAMHAKKKLGAVTYAIYPNTNMEAIAELYARAQSPEYKLNPKFKCHPYDGKKTKEVYDAEFKKFQEMTARPEFNQMVKYFKNQNNNINPKFKPKAEHETDPAKKSAEIPKENPDSTAASLEATKPTTNNPTTNDKNVPADPSFKVKLPPKP